MLPHNICYPLLNLLTKSSQRCLLSDLPVGDRHRWLSTPVVDPLNLHQVYAEAMLSLGCHQSMNKHGRGISASPFLSDMRSLEWAALLETSSLICGTVMWQSPYPACLPPFPWWSDMHHDLETSLLIDCSWSLFLYHKYLPLKFLRT